MSNASLVHLTNQSPHRVTFHVARGDAHDSAAAPHASFRLTVPPLGAVHVPAALTHDDWSVAAVVESSEPGGNTITTASHPIQPGARFSLGLDANGAPALRNDASVPDPAPAPLLSLASSWDDGVTEKLQGRFDFALQKQAQSQWCWAAVTSSVAAYFGNASQPSQTDLAVWAFGPSCQITPGSKTCDQPYSMLKSLTHTGNCTKIIRHPVGIDVVKESVDHKKPLGLGIFWTNGSGGHAITITGYDIRNGNDALIAVQDPGDPPGTITVCPFAQFPSKYSGGAEWRQTFLTHHVEHAAPTSANTNHRSH